MKTNLLKAINNAVKNPFTKLLTDYKSNNRVNNMGDALEYYIKDLFCSSYNIKNTGNKIKEYHKFFSYLGNKNNPPDIMIKDGDAIEVKKIESIRSGIALNSSYPKDKLYSDSPLITQDCKDCENWEQKDMIYIIGTLSSNNNLSALWFVDGSCYAANRNVYDKIKDQISKGINELPNVDFAETNELGRINKVDPLGITLLRIRGMWHIDNPVKVYDYITEIDSKSKFSLRAIISTEKFNKFPDEDRQLITENHLNEFNIQDVEIKNPNNPAKLINAKLISYTI